MKLHTHPLSGHAHRAELFLSLAGVEYESIAIDLAAGAHKQPSFLEDKNVFGQIPVLEDGDMVIADSNAIMVYISRKLGLEDWYPRDPYAVAQIQRWLSIAAGPIAYGPAAARLVTVFGSTHDPKTVIERAHALYQRVEVHLEGRIWLASEGQPTIADVAFYSYTANAPEGNVDVSLYPRVCTLLRRIEALPGFLPFTQTDVGLDAT